jgi:hypothetical protein
MRSRLLSGLCAVAVTVLALVASPASLVAQNGAYLQTDRLGYTGTLARFDNFADWLAGTHPVSVVNVPQRDLALLMIDDNPAFSGAIFPPSAFYFWTFSYANGGNTPSNSNVGIVQIADDDAGSVISADGWWTNPARTEFQYVAKGRFTFPGCPPYTPGMRPDCPLLWNGGPAAGPPPDIAFGTDGVFTSYAFSLLASGLAPAVWNPAYGVWESISEPTSVQGKFSGMFINTSPDDPARNGFYRVDLTMNMTSYAFEQGWMLPSVFGSARTVPEPSTWALLATGLVGMGAVLRRRRSR